MHSSCGPTRDGEACEGRAGRNGNDNVVPGGDRATARAEHAGGRDVVPAVARATARDEDAGGRGEVHEELAEVHAVARVVVHVVPEEEEEVGAEERLAVEERHEEEAGAEEHPADVDLREVAVDPAVIVDPIAVPNITLQ